MFTYEVVAQNNSSSTSKHTVRMTQNNSTSTLFSLTHLTLTNLDFKAGEAVRVRVWDILKQCAW
jgi:hypothetical protein